VQANFATALSDGVIVTGGNVFGTVQAGEIIYRSDFGFGPLDGHMFLVAHHTSGRLLDHVTVFEGCSAGVRDAATNATGGLAMVGSVQSSVGGLEPCLRLAGKVDAVIMLLETTKDG
jgi:hypothetical protein